VPRGEWFLALIHCKKTFEIGTKSMRFTDKVALITGGAQGIGFAPSPLGMGREGAK